MVVIVVVVGCRFLNTWRHWYLYIRRIVTTYFIPLQLGVVAGLLWANIDEDSYVYLWGNDEERTLDLGGAHIAGEPVLHNGRELRLLHCSGYSQLPPQRRVYVFFLRYRYG